MTDSTYAKRGTLVRLVYLAVAAAWYIFTVGGRIRRSDVIVLCYHGVLQRQRQRFRRQMSWIAGRVISCDEFAAAPLRQGRAVPRVMVTFDDAFANLLDNALPVLEEFNIPAIIFAVTGNLGENPRWRMPENHPEVQEPLMTGEQIAAVARNPSFRIGSHTVTHVDLTQVSRQQAQDELSRSKRQLEELLGTPVEDFALPHGAHNQHVMDMIQTAGYQRIFTIDSRSNRHSGHSGVIGRFSMSPDVWPTEFILTCAGAYAWLYNWRRLIRSIRRQPML